MLQLQARVIMKFGFVHIASGLQTMAKNIRYIGNYDINANGKFLWEILTQLRELGRGRIVTKNEWLRKWPKQPSYLRVIKAQPAMDRWLLRGKLWAEWTFRGHNLGIYEFSHDLNRPDWRLIHRHDEAEFTRCHSKMESLEFPSSMPLPPYLRVVHKNGEIVDIDEQRINLDLCIDPQFEMVRHLFKQVEHPHKTTIYDEANPDAWLDLYGNELPTKVEAWNVGPAELRLRFENKIPVEQPPELDNLEIPQVDFNCSDHDDSINSDDQQTKQNNHSR